MASGNLPYGSNMPVMGNRQRGNLRIVFEEGQVVQCGICKDMTEDIFCFCKKCEKHLDLKCAGVTTELSYNEKNQVMIRIPMTKELPKSCLECLRIKLIDLSISWFQLINLTNSSYISLNHWLCFCSINIYIFQLI